MAWFITLDEYNKCHHVPLSEEEYKALCHKELEEFMHHMCKPKYELDIVIILIFIVAMISENFLSVFYQIKSLY